MPSVRQRHMRGLRMHMLHCSRRGPRCVHLCLCTCVYVCVMHPNGRMSVHVSIHLCIITPSWQAEEHGRLLDAIARVDTSEGADFEMAGVFRAASQLAEGFGAASSHLLLLDRDEAELWTLAVSDDRLVEEVTLTLGFRLRM